MCTNPRHSCLNFPSQSSSECCDGLTANEFALPIPSCTTAQCGGMPSPLMGIAPHIYVHRTLADLESGKDTALLAALRWVKSHDPVPERQQPLAPFAR